MTPDFEYIDTMRHEATGLGIVAPREPLHWARKLKALGHDVHLMPASYAKAYVKRAKNDAADAAGRTIGSFVTAPRGC